MTSAIEKLASYTNKALGEVPKPTYLPAIVVLV